MNLEPNYEMAARGFKDNRAATIQRMQRSLDWLRRHGGMCPRCRQPRTVVTGGPGTYRAKCERCGPVQTARTWSLPVVASERTRTARLYMRTLCVLDDIKRDDARHAKSRRR